MPKGKVKAKKIYRGVLKQEKKIAKREVGKAKKMIHRKKKWTVAADAMGWRGGYDSKRGGWLRYGREPTMAQAPSDARYMPASSAHMWRTEYKRTQKGSNLLVVGRQKIAAIQANTVSSQNAFFVNGATVNVIQISPDSIGGQMATDARNYAYYRFKKIKFIAVMNASSTDTLTLGLAYEQDPTISSFQTVTYDSMQQSTNFVSTARKAPDPLQFVPRGILKSSQKMFHCELDTASIAGTQQSVQGVLFGFFSGADASGAQYGDLLMEFELELIDRMPDYGFTSSVSTIEKMQDTFYRKMSESLSAAALCQKCNEKEKDDGKDGKVPPCAVCQLVADARELEGYYQEWLLAAKQLPASRVLLAAESGGKDPGYRGGYRAVRDLMIRAGLGDTPNVRGAQVVLVDYSQNIYASGGGGRTAVTTNSLQVNLPNVTNAVPLPVTPWFSDGASMKRPPVVPNAGGTTFAPVVVPAGTNSDGSQYLVHTSDPVGAIMVATAPADSKEDVVVVETPMTLQARKEALKRASTKDEKAKK